MASLVNISVDKALLFLPRVLLVILLFFINNLRAEDILLNVNVKKPVALTSDKFLSYTLDPMVVLTSNALIENPERSVNMAKALAPAYVRIAGPRSNSYTFEKPHEHQDPDFTFSEGDWIVVHRWAENAGLDILACIAPQHSESGGREPGWDSRNALDLISFSDHMGFNTSWQLGYECQTRCDVSSIDIARDVMRLRNMLDAFPRYSKSVITGPDVVTYRTKHQQQYLQDYLSVAGTALSAITWHPNFATITLDSAGVSLHHDNLAVDRDGLYRVLGRLISKKPLWLAESKPEPCKKQFLGALVWTRRLGNAAKLGVQVLMRQPFGSNLIQPTPDYWVSVLHKSLVGPEVLDTKIVTGNRTHVHFYCQCTKPSSKYEKGSLTIFGINLAPSKIVANLKGIKIKTLHKYILMPGFDSENRMFSENVLLNNEPLELLNEKELPEIKPAISTNNKGVALKLPSGGIGFWVIPGLKIKLCGGVEEDNADKMFLKRLTRRLEGAESDEDSFNVEEEEEGNIDGNILAEDRRFSPISDKIKRKRKYRYSEEDDTERRFKKWEARQDLERLEKLFRRRDNHDDRKVSRGPAAYYGFDENSQERMNDESEAEEMRVKLNEYKSRLKEYENRQKKDITLESKISETQDNDTIGSGMVVEALRLISKMENTMKILEKNVDDSPTYKIQNPEDRFLDELLRSEKIKRTSISPEIEDQLRTIYQMLADEKVRRQSNPQEVSKLAEEPKIDDPLQVPDETLSRARRDTEKKFDDDPLGRMDRRRNKEKEGCNNGPVIFDRKTIDDSNENNFYGFQQRPPLKGFPYSDVFVKIGTSSEETGKDYDYVKDDDDDVQKEQARAQLMSRNVATNKLVPDDTTSIEEENAEFIHVPKEFFEDVKMGGPRVQPRSNIINYSELWKAESLGHEQTSQDQSFSEDQEGTIDEVIEERRPDAYDDKRAKETAVKKLIGYNGPRSYIGEANYEKEDETYINRETLEKPEGSYKGWTRTSVPFSAIRNQRPIYRNPVMAMNNEGATRLSPYDFTDYDSRYFGKATKASVQSRAKRSTDDATRDVEQIMDKEMIFQDDNNLKDCDCRVQRGVRISKRQEDRKKRIEDLKRRQEDRKKQQEDPVERRRGFERIFNKDRKDGEKLLITRAKRQTNSISAELEETILDGQVESSEIFSSEPDSIEEDEYLPASVESREGAEDLVESPISSVVEEAQNSTVEEDNKDLTVDEEKADLPSEESSINKEEEATLAPQQDKLVDEESIKNLNPELKLENEAHDSKTDYIKKRHNADHTFQPDSGIVSENTESPIEGQRVLEVESKDYSVTYEPNKVLTHNSEADQLFLVPQTDIEATPKTFQQTSKTDITRPNFGFSEPFENAQTSSSEINQSAIGPRSIAMETKPEISSTANTATQKDVIEKENRTIDQSAVYDWTVASAHDLLEDAQALSLYNEGEEVVADKKAKKETKEDVTKITTESEISLLTTEKVSKLPKLTKDGTRIPRKISQKTKSPTKGLQLKNAAKLKESRQSAKSAALHALRKENDSRKPKKPLKVNKQTTKSLSNEQIKLKDIQNKHAEQLKKLREKLRLKREKIAQEYQDELMTELKKTTDGEQRNLMKRDIIDMINDDEEIRDIVDQEKLKYLMQANPVNYEEIRDDYRTEDLEQRKQYVPEMTEILKPLHKVRERTVKVQHQPVGHSNDPKLLAYSAPDDSSNSEAIRKSLREAIDLTDHKIERRTGKSYHSDVESLEKPTIHQYSSGEVSAEQGSLQVCESAELGEIRSSSDEEENAEEQIYPIPNEDSRSQDEGNYPPRSNYPLRFTRNTSDNKNQSMYLNDKSGDSSIENKDELFKVAKENDPYKEKSVWQEKSNDKGKHITKKKYFKDLEYEQMSKYKSPKYERLAPKKIEADRYLTLQNPSQYEDDNHKNDFKDITSRDSETKYREGDNEDELCFTEDNIEEAGQLASELEMIDDLDFDEVLNSNNYELLMLIPVKNQNKNRQRRHAGNELSRDEDDSDFNEISMDISDLPSKNSVVQKIKITKNDDRRDSTQTTVLQDLTDNEVIDESASKRSTIINAENFSPSTKQDGSILDELAIAEISQSVPQTVSHKESVSIHGLTDLIEVAIPELGATLNDGLGKARHISASFEKFIDEFDDRLNQNEAELEAKYPESIEVIRMRDTAPISSNVFSRTIMSTKKFFDFLTSMVHSFRFN